MASTREDVEKIIKTFSGNKNKRRNDNCSIKIFFDLNMRY
jgi:hypothetical protein